MRCPDKNIHSQSDLWVWRLWEAWDTVPYLGVIKVEEVVEAWYF
jgi:hypothetical protein